MRKTSSIAAALLIGCSGPTVDDTASPDEGWQGDTDIDTFFSLERVHRVSVDLDDDAWSALLEDPRDYVHGDVDIDGQRFDDVGVRLKGGAGSFVPLDGDYPEESGDGNGNPGKSALILNLDKYVDDQELLGIEKLTVNNLVQDDSCIHETAGYALWREAGIAAPRTAYADITLNGEAKGLFLLVESQDNSLFLDDHYGTDEGNLYEGVYGMDIEEEFLNEFDQDNGDDESMDDLRELAWWLDEAEAVGGEEGFELMSQRVDMGAYLAFAATEIYLGHWDGYAQSMNNYKIHHHPDTDRWTFLPWGSDQLFEDEMGMFGGVMMEPGPEWHGGRVHRICFDSSACRAELAQAFDGVLARVEEMELAELAEEAQALIETRALAESTAYGDPERTEESWEEVQSFIERRPEQIGEWLDCLWDEPVDHDGDGWNGCTEDPDDYSAEVGP